MADIIGTIREKIFRRPKIASLAGEELSEKQTTKWGYFLLICMFLAILSSGQWTIGIIQNIPQRPQNLPYCISGIYEKFVYTYNSKGFSLEPSDYFPYGYRDYSQTDCQTTGIDPAYDMTKEYEQFKNLWIELDSLEKEISQIQSNVNSLESKKTSRKQEYDTSLLEDIAWNQQRMYNGSEIQNTLSADDQEIQTLKSQISQLESQYTQKLRENLQNFQGFRLKIESFQEDYRIEYLKYRFYVAILTLIFAGSVFFVLYKMYMRQKLKNSPHTIIFSFATFAYGLILLEILLLFLWDIIPHKIFEILLKILNTFAPLIFLVQFLWPVVIVGIFGFAVYKIQKRLYSKENILKRFVSDKKCPHCGNHVDINKAFCPLCAYEIQIHCPECQALTVKGMPHCSTCGKKI